MHRTPRTPRQSWVLSCRLCLPSTMVCTATPSFSPCTGGVFLTSMTPVAPQLVHAQYFILAPRRVTQPLPQNVFVCLDPVYQDGFDVAVRCVVVVDGWWTPPLHSCCLFVCLFHLHMLSLFILLFWSVCRSSTALRSLTTPIGPPPLSLMIGGGSTGDIREDVSDGGVSAGGPQSGG